MEVTRVVTTPFREHLLLCRELSVQSQLAECVDYIHHIEVLVSEFLESYYMVERDFDPNAPVAAPEDEELVLEPFFESLELSLSDADADRMTCVCGALDPLTGMDHAALTRRGVDFVALANNESHQIVLGAVQSEKTESPFVLLLRGLSALAELSPPLRMATLGREVLHAGIPEDATFSLCLAINEFDEADEDLRALRELTRDLAEAFVAQANDIPQLAGMIAKVYLCKLGATSLSDGRLETLWSL